MWIAIAVLGGIILGALMLGLGVLIGVAVTENTHDREARARGEKIDIP